MKFSNALKECGYDYPMDDVPVADNQAAIPPCEMISPTMVEQDSNNYSLINICDSCEIGDKTIGIIYDEITSKKFYVFICNCSLAFKKFSNELSGFVKSKPFCDLKEAGKVFHKLVDYLTDVAPNNQGLDNVGIFDAAMAYVCPSVPENISKQDDPLPSFVPQEKDFEDFFNTGKLIPFELSPK